MPRIGCYCTAFRRVVLCPRPVDRSVGITIRANGMEVDTSDVQVSNFKAGDRAEMTYRIHNATPAAVQPILYVVNGAKVENYSKADGAVSYAPASAWMEIPAIPEVAPGAITDVVVALNMPKEATFNGTKFGLQIGASVESNKQITTAVGTWWIVSMR